MKRNRNPTNKSVMKRYTTLDSLIGSQLLLDRSSFGSRSFFVRFSFILRSSFVHPSIVYRRSIEERTKNEREAIEKLMEAQGRNNGG